MRQASQSSTLAFLLAVLFVGCSTRQVYQTQANSLRPEPNAININTASVGEFEKLPHIGHKTAEMIVQFREENGPFRRVEQIMQIRGISETRFTEIRQFLKTE